MNHVDEKKVGRPRTPFDVERHSEIVRLRQVLNLSKYRCAAIINVSNAAYNQYELKQDNFIGVEKQEELLKILRKMAHDRGID